MAKNKEEKKSKIIHIKKFGHDTNMTPQEMSTAYGIRKRCHYCNAPAQVRFRVLVHKDDALKKWPDFCAMIMHTNPDGPSLPTIPTTYGPMLRISDVGACSRCRKQAELVAAKGPSWAIVEISGDYQDTIQSQVPDKVSP